ncbi:conserved hypothetical protein [Trichinella spiralis]|nr:conserved hypothetical protein [Trichinella spiralis]
MGAQQAVRKFNSKSVYCNASVINCRKDQPDTSARAYFSRVSVLFESSKQADLDEQNRLFSRLRNFQVVPDVVLVLDEMPACERGEGGWEGVFRGEGVGRFRRRKSID